MFDLCESRLCGSESVGKKTVELSYVGGGSVLIVVIAVGCVTVAVVNIVHVVVMRDGLMAAVLTVDVVGMCMGFVVIAHWVNICALMH